MSFLSDYVSYFENLASQHMDILHSEEEKHFFRMELEEILTGIRSEAYFPLFSLEPYNIGFGSKNSNNIMKSFNGAFTILKKVEESGDFDRIHEVWEECEKIGTDFIIMMNGHRFQYEDEHGLDTANFLKNFDINSVEGTPVANSHDEAYGFRFTFTIVSKTNHIVDPAKWTSLK